MQLDPVIGLAEPDQEVQELLKASGGLNLGMDFLPGSLGFDPLAFQVEPRGGRPDRLVRRADQQRRPLVAQPQHAGLARRPVAHRPRRHHDLAPQLARARETSAAKPYDASDHVLAPFAPDVGGRRRRAGAAGHRGAARRGHRRRSRTTGWRTSPASTPPTTLRRAYVGACWPRAATSTSGSRSGRSRHRAVPCTGLARRAPRAPRRQQDRSRTAPDDRA